MIRASANQTFGANNLWAAFGKPTPTIDVADQIDVPVDDECDDDNHIDRAVSERALEFVNGFGCFPTPLTFEKPTVAMSPASYVLMPAETAM